MLLKEYLAKNWKEVLNNVFDWEFGDRRWELKVVSKTHLDYKQVTNTAWHQIEIENIRKFEIMSVRVIRDGRTRTPRVFIKTNNP